MVKPCIGRACLAAAVFGLFLSGIPACDAPAPGGAAVPTPESERLIAAAREHESAGRLPEALAAYEAALAGQPQLAAACVRAADLARRTGEAEAAARHARRALAGRPSDPAVICTLARALAPVDAARAQAALRPLLETVPDRADVRLAAGEAALAGGDPAAALPHLRAALAAGPDPAELLDIGRAFSRAGFHADAVAAVRRALEAGDRSPDARYTLGWTLERAERYEECVREYGALIEDHPEYLPAYRNLGALMARDGELPRAIRLWERGLRYHPDDPGLRANIDAAMDALGLTREDPDG